MSAAHQSNQGATRVLIVDDDSIVSSSIRQLLEARGYTCSVASSGHEALEILSAHDESATPINVVLTDLQMGIMSGLELLEHIREDHKESAVVVLTGFGSIESAVRAIKLGAVEYLTKPVVDDELVMAIEKALSHQVLMAENASLRRRLKETTRVPGFIGHEHNLDRIMDVVRAVAPTPTTVLMSGESGTGKSLIARTIHELSDRSDGPFVELACGSIPETLLESELFGHTKGAFTGAHADKRGKFEVADGGTIFLDEINSASPAMQLKLLRVIQERCFERVGSTQPIEVDVRVLVASNEPLDALVTDGSFRQDLYYRISVVTIDLPPLRERPSDVPLLVEHFLALHSSKLDRIITGVTPDAMRALERYRYPGNVRELSNIIERAVVLARQATITLEDLPDIVTNSKSLPPAGTIDDGDMSSWTPTALSDALRQPERDILLRALRANDWNRQKTADDLQINRTTLYKKIKSYGLDRMAG